MEITYEVSIVVGCVLVQIYKTFFVYVSIWYNECVTHICNMVAIFIQWHVKYLYSDKTVETWFEIQLKQ